MSTPTTLPLKVIRLPNKTIAQGTILDLIPLAERGEIDPRDKIEGIVPFAFIEPAEVPELAPFVPTPREYFTRRSFRSLAIFIGVLMAVVTPIFVAAFHNAPAHTMDIAKHLLELVCLVALMASPLPFLWRNARRLRDERLGRLAPELDVAPTRPARGKAPLVTALATLVALVALAGRGAMGARYGIPASGVGPEFWRILSSSFVHAVPTTAVLQSLAFREAGRAAETFFGWSRVALIVVLSATASSLIRVALPSAEGFGLTGIVAAMISATVVVLLRDGSLLRDHRLLGSLASAAVVLSCASVRPGALLADPFDASLVGFTVMAAGVGIGALCGWAFSLPKVGDK